MQIQIVEAPFYLSLANGNVGSFESDSLIVI